MSKSTVSGMLSGVRFSRKAVMIAFLRACGVPNDGMESWRRAWERVVSGEEGPARLKVTPAAPGRPPTEITASADPSEAGQVRGEADRPVRQSMWHFPGDSRIILVSYRLPPDRRPPSSDPDSLNYVRFSDSGRPGCPDRNPWCRSVLQPNVAGYHHGSAGFASARCREPYRVDWRISLESRDAMVFSYLPDSDRSRRSLRSRRHRRSRS